MEVGPLGWSFLLPFLFVEGLGHELHAFAQHGQRLLEVVLSELAGLVDHQVNPLPP